MKLGRFVLAAAFLAAAAGTAQDQAAIVVPFEFKANIIVIKGKLNDQEALFILDTGASMTCITPKAAKKAGIESNGMMGRVDSIQVGDASVKGHQVAVMDPPQARPLRDVIGVDYSGIVGQPFLKKFVTTFDYRRQQITFVPAKDAPELTAEGGARLVPFKLVNNIILIEGRMNGKGPHSFIFDSGASHCIVVPSTAEDLGLKRRRGRSQLGNVEVATLDTLAVGEAEPVKEFEMVVMDPPQAQPLRMLGAHYDGILGRQFFDRFLVTLDYRAKKIRLSPHDGPGPAVKTEAAARSGEPILADIAELLKSHRERFLAELAAHLDRVLR
jgi:predicted aspartyl protease